MFLILVFVADRTVKHFLTIAALNRTWPSYAHSGHFYYMKIKFSTEKCYIVGHLSLIIHFEAKSIL